jgi:hypothetical protein
VVSTAAWYFAGIQDQTQALKLPERQSRSAASESSKSATAAPRSFSSKAAFNQEHLFAEEWVRNAKRGWVNKEEAAAFFDNWRHRQPLEALDWALRMPFTPAELGLHRVLHLLAEGDPEAASLWINSHPGLVWRDEAVLVLLSAMRSASGDRPMDTEPLQPWLETILNPGLRHHAQRLLHEEPSSIDFDTGLLRIRWDLPKVVHTSPPLELKYLSGVE